MGVVLAAHHVVTNKPVAIKWLLAPEDDHRRARLLAEAKNAGRIQHANVIDVYDFGQEDDAVYLVMERLSGVPLTVAMNRGSMTPDDALRLMMPVLRGVAAAHERGVIHRDLKPDNIFLCEDSGGNPHTVKVLDFGISKVATEPSQLTQAGMVVGTPLYMAPEQMKGGGLDGRCDQYAAGCLLFEMIEGVPAFEAETFEALSAAKLSGASEPFRALVPEGLQNVIQRAMERDAEKRYTTIDAFAEALEPFTSARFADTDTDWSGLLPYLASEASHGSQATTLPEPAVLGDETVREPRVSARWRLGVAGLLILAVVVGVGWWFQGRGPQSVAQSVEQSVERPVERAVEQVVEPSAEQVEEAVEQRVEQTVPEIVGGEPSEAVRPNESDPENVDPELAVESVSGMRHGMRRTLRERMTTPMHRTKMLSVDEF